MDKERRSATRFTIKQFVDLSSNGEDFIHVTANDLSLGGLSCISSTPLDPMMPVFLLLGFSGEDGEKTVELEGYVAHSRMENGKCVAGIAFTDRPPETRNAIETYLAALPPLHQFGAAGLAQLSPPTRG